MKISVITTITNPEKRQDKWIEALNCYRDLADEVVMVDGSEAEHYPIYLDEISKETVKFVYLRWPYEWNWVELPRHLNAGLDKCTGDWVIRLDIDQFIHEDDFEVARAALRRCPDDCDVVTFQKMSMTYGKKYYQKGGQPIAFKRKNYIKFGLNLDKKTDLCFPVRVTEHREIDGYKLPIGHQLKEFKGGVKYLNYDYFFKTKDFTKKEFFRFSRAYHRYFKKWTFGRTERKAFDVFLKMMKGRHDRSPYTYELKDHPKHIREAVRNLTKDQFGLNAWGLL